MSQPRNVALFVFNDVETLDFAGPYEVFSVTARLHHPTPFNVYSVALTNDTVTTRGRLCIQPRYTIENCPQPDILLVPGGYGTRTLMADTVLLGWVKQQAAQVSLLLSVCTGALVLARAGLLDGLESTTHHDSFDLLRKEAPNTMVWEDRRFVDNGQVITSGGISAGIDMALHVVARELGDDVAQATADHMEYRWLP